MTRRLATVALLALAFPSAAFARGDFDPTKEFEQKDWVPIHLGPIDLSITKAVVYLLLSTVVTILLGIFLMRFRLSEKPGARQTIGESIYEVAQTQVAEQGLPSKAIGRWFPYVASLLLFIFVVNLLGFIPLPITGETYHGEKLHQHGLTQSETVEIIAMSAFAVYANIIADATGMEPDTMFDTVGAVHSTD